MKRPRSESGVAPWQLALIAAMLLIGLFLARPAENLTAVTPTAAPTAFPAQRGLRVAVASDLHFDPMNTDRSGEISEVLYSPELAEALLWDARQQGASLLLLTGDLVNGGSAARHEALAGMLRQAEETGLEVYVLPGNHDLAPVGQRDFAAFYGEFGYDEAWSRDRASLSYCVLREDLALLMLDCGGYSAGAIDLPEARNGRRPPPFSPRRASAGRRRCSGRRGRESCRSSARGTTTCSPRSAIPRTAATTWKTASGWPRSCGTTA